MKKYYLALTTLALLASPTWAKHLDDNPDVQQSILNVHDGHYPHAASDTGHGPAKGSGDTYGSVHLDLGSHFPHQPGDRHDPEAGKGDNYGSVLLDIDRMN